MLSGAHFVAHFDLVRALFGGMTLLVPAMVIVIGTHELAAGALESGVARLAHGVLRFTMLGAGIAAAVKLWLLVAALPPMPAASPLPTWAVLGILLAGAAALVICLQGRRADVASVFLIGVAGHLWARSGPDRLASPVLVAGLLQVAPGLIGTQAVVGLLHGEPGHDTFFQVLLVAVQLVAGLVLASVLLARGPSRR